MDQVEVDVETPKCAFGLSEDLQPFDTDWHSHTKHQILFASKGSMHLEVDGFQWFLPPQRAVWIRAKVPHRVRTNHPIELRNVYLPPEAAPLASTHACRVFAVNSLGREMILHGMAWGADRDPGDTFANGYFSTLAGLVAQWVNSPLPYVLPVAQSPGLARAMRFTLENLESADIESVAKAAGMSPRTLARRFTDETHTTWQQWSHAARMLRAMELLSVKNSRVTEAALEIGYTSHGAFSHAFAAFTGETPSSFRKRARL